MAIIKSIYDEMEEVHQKLMFDNSNHLENMLDFAIRELVEIARDNEICLVDNLKLCTTYEDIFECLKHRSERRIESNK